MIESAGPSGATLQVLQEAQQAMGLEEESSESATGGQFRKSAARCWAMLLARHRRRRDRGAIPFMNVCLCNVQSVASLCGSSRSSLSRR
ncbi:MAG: hypothetical protein ACI9UQ_001080 [Candidatus Krumholzibacteriia bacterium]